MPSEDLYCEEVDPSQHGDGFNELLPRRVLAAFRHRRDAMPLQGVPPNILTLRVTGRASPYQMPIACSYCEDSIMGGHPILSKAARTLSV
jgi:hypothetical protein